MARFEVTGPDGARYQVEGPDGTTEQDALAQVQKQVAAQPPSPQRSPSQDADAPLPNAPPPKPAGPPVQSLDQALAGIQAPDIGSVSPAMANTVNRVVQAGVEGAKAVPSTQPVRDWVTRTVGPVPGALINPLIYGAGGVLAAGAGAYRGAQQLGVEAISPILGPQAARDIVSIPDAFGGSPGAPSVPGRPPIPQAPPPRPRFIGEYPGGGVDLPGTPSLNRLTDLIVRVDDTAPPRPGRGVSEPEAGAPQPRTPVPPAATPDPWLTDLSVNVQDVLKENGYPSLGAAGTPTNAAGMTPAQIKSNRRMIELRDVLEPPGLGEDLNIHVEGSYPTLAERAGDPAISQRENVVRQRNPNAFDPRLSENSRARIKKFDDMAGTDPQLTTLQEQQAAQAKADTQKIMQTAKPADLAPAVAHIDELLNDPRIREVDDVVRVLKPLREKLFDADGNLKTDPQAVWGMHDNLMNLLAKGKDPLNATGAEKFAFDQMNQFKKTLDSVMNAATDGNFQAFLDNQAGFFQRRNAMEVLQKFRTQMVDAKTGHIYADKFHRWLADLAVRRGKVGIDKAMDIPDEVMQGLIDINKDLKRASRIDLGKARGSPTNLYGEVAKAAGLAGVHALLGAGTGGIGNVALQLAAPQVRSWQLNRLTQQHLTDPKGGFPRNQLGP